MEDQGKKPPPLGMYVLEFVLLPGLLAEAIIVYVAGKDATTYLAALLAGKTPAKVGDPHFTVLVLMPLAVMLVSLLFYYAVLTPRRVSRRDSWARGKVADPGEARPLVPAERISAKPAASKRMRLLKSRLAFWAQAILGWGALLAFLIGHMWHHLVTDPQQNALAWAVIQLVMIIIPFVVAAIYCTCKAWNAHLNASRAPAGQYVPRPAPPKTDGIDWNAPLLSDKARSRKDSPARQ